MKDETAREKILANRERLKSEKPKVYEKIMKNINNGGKGLFLLDLVYNFECNFRCTHCCAEAFAKDSRHETMTFENIKRIADMADELGVVVISLIGGEPLVWNELEEIVNIIDPSRFLINITTNGSLLSASKIDYLYKIGISKINISIDSFIEEEHDMFRNHKGSYAKAMSAIRRIQEIGKINLQISTVATHENIYQQGFLGLLDFSKENGIPIDLKVATPTGNWLGNTDACCTEEDAKRLDELHESYPLLRRDLWSTPGKEGGCPALTDSLYILPNGDVLPCIFIHISLGNIFKEPLKQILERGYSIKELHEHSDVCLAGQECDFFNKYIKNTFDKTKFPLSFEDGFMIK